MSETTARAIVKLREKHRDLKIVKYKRDKTPVWGYDDDAPIKNVLIVSLSSKKQQHSLKQR